MKTGQGSELGWALRKGTGMLASERTAVISCHFRERLRGTGTSAQD